MNLQKKKILKLLAELDILIDQRLDLAICGGAAGILIGAFRRNTLDIDIVESSRSLSDYEDALEKIAQKYGLSQRWLNAKASAFIDTLPDDFRDRLIPVDGGFAFLHVYALSSTDLFFMKLAALRPGDVKDLEHICTQNIDMSAVRNGLDKLRSKNPSQAALVQGYMQERGFI